MSGSEHARPVWADQNDAEALQWAANQAAAQGFIGWANDLQKLYDQHRDAPADPAEAIAKLLARDWYGEEWCDLDDETRLDHFEKARDVLRALGHPKEY